MKNRRYFICPIQALYMMKEFGVEFESFDYYALINQIEQNKSAKCQYYVTLKSESIFEQKKCDIGIQQDNGYLAIAKAQEFEDFEENNGTVSPSHYWKIIMRDNKHFFMGELENETQH